MSNTMTNDVQSIAKDNIDRTMSGLKNGVSSATAGLQQAQATMQDGMQKAMKTATEMFAFNQGNVEAVSRSTQILASGVQDLGQSVAETARATADDTMNTMKAFAGVKSVKDMMDLQSSLIRAMIERTVSQTSRMTDRSMKLSEQVMAPITARLAIAAQTFGRVD